MISLTLPSFKRLIAHRHTITAFMSQSSPDRGRERKTEGGKSGRGNLQQRSRTAGWRDGGVKAEKAQDVLRKERGAESEVKEKAWREWRLHYF